MSRSALTPKQITIAPSAARAATASLTSSTYTNPGYKGIKVYLDVTLDPASASITLTLQGKDPLSGDWHTLLASAAVTSVTTGPNVYTIFPGAPVTSNVSANTFLPRVWRVIVVGADTDSMTYSISADLLP